MSSSCKPWCVNHPDFRAALYSEKDEYEGCMRLIDWKRGNPYVWTLADERGAEAKQPPLCP